MIRPRFRHVLAVSATLAIVLSLAGAASAQSAEKKAFRGFYLGALYSSMSNPHFRGPSGSGELPIPQSASAPGFMLGYDIGAGGFGLGARLVYFHAAYKSFATTEMPGMPVEWATFVQYADPKFTHISGDLMVYWLPFRGVTFGIYGLLGLASSSESYGISGSTFPEWNGLKSIGEFDYSYGLGLRFSPLRMISAFGEIRFIPGNLTTTYHDYLYSDDTWDYFGHSHSYTANTSSLLSFGLSVNF